MLVNKVFCALGASFVFLPRGFVCHCVCRYCGRDVPIYSPLSLPPPKPFVLKTHWRKSDYAILAIVITVGVGLLVMAFTGYLH